MVGAGSPRTVARRTIRIVIFDEIDKYKPTSEGNILSIGRHCLTTFRHRAKEIDTCTPTIPGSNIDRAYEESDQRELYIPCPSCGHRQSMIGKFHKQVKWDDSLPTREEQAASAHYHCEACESRWSDAERIAAVDKGAWIAKKPFTGVAGFWISQLYSPWRLISEIVLEFLTKKDDPQELQTFVNCTLAENWLEKGEAPEWRTLVDRQEEYAVGTVPAGALVLVAGADVHPDRIEVEVVGYGRQRESWSVDYLILDGKTSELIGPPGHPSPWEKLSALLGELYPHASGVDMPISRLFVDSANQSNDVYQWVRTQPQDRVVACRGVQRSNLPVGQPSPVDVTIGGRKLKHGLKIRTVWVDFFKAEFYADLKKRAPTPEEKEQGWVFPPGYCHFPKGKNYGDEHFQQICAEQLVTRRNKKGRTVREWEQLRARNEALDCRIYARGAAWDYGLDRFQEKHWRNFEARLGIQRRVAAPPPAAPPQATAPNVPAPQPHYVQQGRRRVFGRFRV
jgi:phage terminase large subunit GpA-like protein